MRPYSSWRQVAGYFDGDGNYSITDLSNRPFKLGLQAIFTDQSYEQVFMFRTFLVHRGIVPSNMLKTSKGTAWMIAIGTVAGVLRASIAMLPHLYKKANEARAVIEYYEDRITGNQLVAVFQEEVLAQRRERRNHVVKVDVPYTFLEGDGIMRERRRQRIRTALEVTRARVTRADFESIRQGHFRDGKRISELQRAYPQYSRETIRRILGRGRAYLLVEGTGRVNTTDIAICEPKTASSETWS